MWSNLKLIIFFCLLNQVLAFDYPRSMKEQTFVENLVKEIPPNSDVSLTLGKFKSELENQSNIVKNGASGAEEKEQAKRYSDLLQSYTDIADPSEDKCSMQDLDDLAMLIELHEQLATSETALIKYLKHHISQQVFVCAPKWELEFSNKIADISTRILSRAIGLLSGFILDISYVPGSTRKPSRPFAWSWSQKAIDKMPPSAILAGIKAFGGLKDVDECLYEYEYPEAKFKPDYERIILASCKPFFNAVAPSIQSYNFVFSKFKGFDERLTPPNLIQGRRHGPLVDHYAAAVICGKIVKSEERSHKNGGKDVIYERVYHQLADEPKFEIFFPTVKEVWRTRFGTRD